MQRSFISDELYRIWRTVYYKDEQNLKPASIDFFTALLSN